MSVIKLLSQIAMEDRRVQQKESKSDMGTLYIILAIFRIFLTIIPQTGYIHPDEYFQSTEIIIGDVFKTERSEVWEFDAGKPLRNIAIPYFLYGIPLFICKWIFNYFNFRGTLSPYYLLVPCRLVICLLSFSVDFSLIRICKKYGTSSEPRLLLLASSFVMLIYGSRTFSNTIEMILFSLLLKTIVVNILDAEKAYSRQLKLKTSLETAENPRQRILIMRQLKQLSHPNYSGSVEIAILCVFGIFNRPTFIIFAIGPVFFWLYRGAPMKKLSLYTIHLRWACLISIALPVTTVLLIADTFYYKRHKSFDILFNVGALACLNRLGDCFVITPFNFIKYNLNNENLSEHGIHPRYLHLVNILLLYNVLGVCFLHMIIKVLTGVIRRRHMFKFDSITALMFVSVTVPLILLSMIPHQEPRFLIPVTLPLVFLCAAAICNNSHSKSCKAEYLGRRIFLTWYAVNLFFICFYGFLHQAGIFPALRHLASVKNGLERKGTRLHVISTHVYSLPKSLLTNAIRDDTNKFSKRSDVIVYPTSSSSFDVPLRQLETIINFVNRSPLQDDRIYFLFPTSLTRNFTRSLASKKLNVKYSFELYIFSHLSTEAMPELTWSSFLNLEFPFEIGLNVVVLKTIKNPDNDEQNDAYFKATDEPSNEQLFARSMYII